MKNNKFNKRLRIIPSEIWSIITKIDELKGQWTGGANLAPQILGRLKRSVLITSTGASTRIEGANLSDEDVERLMKGISIQKFADRDKQEVKGYYELLEKVFDSWRSISFSEGSIKHLHKELLTYVEKDKLHRGEYKKTENKVKAVDSSGKSIGILFDTTPAYLTPKEMQELMEWTQGALEKETFHPLLVIGNFIVEFLLIHPFRDGNGRLSRILTNLLLLKRGYLFMPYVSHEKLIEDDKPAYYIALRKSQKTFKTKSESVSAWLEFFIKSLLIQSKTAIELLSKQNIEAVLSHKQLSVLKCIESFDEVTPGKIATDTGIPRQTVNQSLRKLLKLNEIEKIGLGRATRYRKI